MTKSIFVVYIYRQPVMYLQNSRRYFEMVWNIHHDIWIICDGSLQLVFLLQRTWC